MQGRNATKRTISEARADLDTAIDAAILAMSEAGFTEGAIVAALDRLASGTSDALIRMERFSQALARLRSELQ
jgi:hypothetical protein